MSQPEQSQDSDVHLTQALADLEENKVLEIVRLRMDRGDDPMRIIDDCQAGMRQVGERYAQQHYFLSGLIMAGEILRQIMDIVMPGVEAKFVGHSSGRVLIGTVQGDIHDLGKNMVMMLLRSYGFSVLDLGVDVPVETFHSKIGHRSSFSNSSLVICKDDPAHIRVCNQLISFNFSV